MKFKLVFIVIALFDWQCTLIFDAGHIGKLIEEPEGVGVCVEQGQIIHEGSNAGAEFGKAAHILNDVADREAAEQGLERNKGIYQAGQYSAGDGDGAVIPGLKFTELSHCFVDA